jgi:hypothetical protein
MEKIFYFLSIVLGTLVVLAALYSVFRTTRPFLERIDEAKQAYAILIATSIGMFIWSQYNHKMSLTSVEIFGTKAEFKQLQEKVATLSEEMEIFFGRKRIETFDRNNWSRIRKVGKSGNHLILEVTLDYDPIPNSVEVFEGPLPMPEQEYDIKGPVLQFPANSDKPTEGITVKYYPRPTPPVH